MPHPRLYALLAGRLPGAEPAAHPALARHLGRRPDDRVRGAGRLLRAATARRRRGALVRAGRRRARASRAPPSTRARCSPSRSSWRTWRGPGLDASPARLAGRAPLFDWRLWLAGVLTIAGVLRHQPVHPDRLAAFSGRFRLPGQPRASARPDRRGRHHRAARAGLYVPLAMAWGLDTPVAVLALVGRGRCAAGWLPGAGGHRARRGESGTGGIPRQPGRWRRLGAADMLAFPILFYVFSLVVAASVRALSGAAGAVRLPAGRARVGRRGRACWRAGGRPAPHARRDESRRRRDALAG